MNKIDFNNLSSRLKRLHSGTPEKAKKFIISIKKIERKLEDLQSQSFFSKVFSSRGENPEEIEKNIEKLEALKTKIKALDDEVKRIRSILNDFNKLLTSLSSNESGSISKLIKEHYDYAEVQAKRVEKLILGAHHGNTILAANKELIQLSEELKRRQECIRLLGNVDKLKTEYLGAEEVEKLYIHFVDIETQYGKAAIEQTFKEIDSKIDELKYSFEKKYPKISSSTQEDLRTISYWLRELMRVDSKVLAMKEIDPLKRESEKLKTQSNTLINHRVSIDVTSKLDNLDKDTFLLLEKVEELAENHKKECLSGFVTLFDELRNYFPDINHLLESYNSLTAKLDNAENFRKWTKEYSLFVHEFDSYIAQKKSHLTNELNKLILKSKKEIQEIENGPCSKDISASVVLLNEKIDKLEKTTWTDKNKELILSVRNIKDIGNEIAKLVEEANEERVDYQTAIESLTQKATDLDTLIKKSELGVNTVSNFIADNISDIDPSSDISIAMSELSNIDKGLEVVESNFQKKCQENINAHKSHINDIHDIFNLLSISYEEPNTTESNTTEQLLILRKYRQELDKKLENNVDLFDKKRQEVIFKVQNTILLPGISVYEQDSLKQLVSTLNTWETNTEKPAESLSNLNMLIVSAEQKIIRYAQEEITAKSRTQQLKQRINELNSNYDTKYFPEVRKTITGMILGAETATNHWEQVNQQLDSAKEALKILELESRRIMIEEYDIHRKSLQSFITKHNKNHNKPLYYDEAVEIESELSALSNQLPSRIMRISLENLLMRLV